MTDLTTVIINYNTADLTIQSAQKFLLHYPAIRLLIIDNHSSEEQQKLLRRELFAHAMIFNKKNVHHGPAMHQALHVLHSSKILFLDSDCFVKRGGFLEQMAAHFEDSTTYAVGHLVFMNKRGFQVASPKNAFPYIRPYCMMIRRSMYMALPSFRHHGTPCLENMRCAHERGYLLVDLPLQEYVSHEGRGTVKRYGYRLGLKGKVNYMLNKIGL